ncbi:MAG: MBL fold metallo-hydrolase [Eubacteriales bacterium]|nr:MBL fold metallo-hydrolase [Eubacteriales bacterium]
MKVTFIFHSSFAVELAEHLLIFDYYGEGALPEMPAGKKLFFLNSHSHPDHFKKEILDLRTVCPGAEYVLSRDIRPGVEADWIHRVRAGEEYAFGGLSVRTLKSTDLGVAFIAEADGKRIYHAGDLNWWHWEGEEKSWNNNMAARYKREIDRLEGERFDAAFLPLDGRLGDAYFWGMEYFLRKAKADAVFPMHCWQQYGICRKVLEEPEMKGLLEHYHPIEREGQEWQV